MMIDTAGYMALGLALIAMMNKKMLVLRSVHLASTVLYAVYGFASNSMPVAIGAILFSGIHLFHIYKMAKKKNKRGEPNGQNRRYTITET